MTITASPVRLRLNSGPRLQIDDDYSEKVRRFSLVLDEEVPKNSPIKKIKNKLKKMLKLQKNSTNTPKSLFLEEKDDSDSEKINFNISVIHNSSGNSLVFWEESYNPL
ncbi:Oidioi.mRNA.OKI2018_I69.chr2.g7849.t1.cds [Oikopleura dioica]|uniref:Oidioi.mRNA.OKI2018_I69.chr2.g7849.t1.cds n=1 Tax=Oikopleura dioica TaxID=34765 RepID=A0ABN7T835_OIKDI|nr:Oidioi.mRNA.OKI2018_I69.chr2.g7849.t1.cds [Oikopleura dioica]